MTTATTDTATTNADAGKTDDAATKAAADAAAKDGASKDGAKSDATKDDTGGKTTDTSGQDDKTKVASKAPDKYELVSPKDALFDPIDLKAIETFARSQNWSQDDAQNYLNAQGAYVAERNAGFLEALTADKELGGTNLAETQRLAEAGLNKVLPKGDKQNDATRELLQRSGYGNHPLIVRVWRLIGKLTDEDKHISGRDGGGDKAPQRLADRMYPKAK